MNLVRRVPYLFLFFCSGWKREGEKEEGRKEGENEAWLRPRPHGISPYPFRRITLHITDNDYHYSPMGLVFTVPAFLSTPLAPVSKFSTLTLHHRFEEESEMMLE